MNSKYKTIKYKKNKPSDIEDLVSIEEPLEMVVRYKKENDWIEQIISYAASKPASEWNDHDFQEATLKIEEMARHFIMSYRLYTLREKHSDTKIIDIAIFEGNSPERSSKFYKFDNVVYV